jgi:predicted dehydrogenase
VRTRVSVGVVGLGYWGPNLARAFAGLPEAELRWLCDQSPDAQGRFRALYPSVRITPDFDDLLNDETLDAVVIATPAVTHHELAGRAIDAGKHVLVEKPLALRGDHADDLVRRAARADRHLMVGHVLLFHPAVTLLKSLVDRGHLGDLFYLYGNRQNLGKVRKDENALWSLGAHDISVMLHLLGDEPVSASAHGDCYVQPGVEDVVFCYLSFATGINAHLHLSWLDPHKMRKLTAVGSERMAVFDDMELERKLTVYDKSVGSRRTETFGEYIHASFGDIVSPRVPNDEPLRKECEHFVAAIRSSAEPVAGGREGAAVVHVLEALQLSLEEGGVPQPVGHGRAVEPAGVIPLRASGIA